MGWGAAWMVWSGRSFASGVRAGEACKRWFQGAFAVPGRAGCSQRRYAPVANACEDCAPPGCLRRLDPHPAPLRDKDATKELAISGRSVGNWTLPTGANWARAPAKFHRPFGHTWRQATPPARIHQPHPGRRAANRVRTISSPPRSSLHSAGASTRNSRAGAAAAAPARPLKPDIKDRFLPVRPRLDELGSRAERRHRGGRRERVLRHR
jgi:hypothetical protein